MESLSEQRLSVWHVHVLFPIKPGSERCIYKQISAETKTLVEHLVRIQESLSGTEQRERGKSAWNKNILKHIIP
jgi:hypothetical protein